MTKIKYSKPIGTPLVPLSPHTQEIGIGDEKIDLEYFERKKLEKLKRAKKAKRRKGEREFISKAANRDDFLWERRIWNALNGNDLVQLEWSRMVNSVSGVREFSSDLAKIRISCVIDSPNCFIISPGRRLVYGLVELKIGEAKARQNDLPIFKEVIWDIVKEQLRLKKFT